MHNLCISVSVRGENPTKYVFEEFPVQIGRAKNNHLSIQHQAVPRELCIARIESDNQTIRVEERPNLTNPLLNGSKLVEGGISGPCLNLTVGPVSLSFSINDMSTDRIITKRRFGLIAILFVAAVSGLIALNRMRVNNSESESSQTALPKTPLCKTVEITCKTQEHCAERMRLNNARSKEILSRPRPSMQDRVHAIMLMQESILIGHELEFAISDNFKKDLKKAENTLIGIYQQEVLVFKQALQNQNEKAARESASRLKEVIRNCEDEPEKLLEQMIISNMTRINAK